MLRILSSKRYWSLIGKIADDQETIKGQANVINFQKKQLEEKQKTIEYLNEIIFKKNRQMQDMISGVARIDFPATEKILSDEDINKLLKL